MIIHHYQYKTDNYNDDFNSNYHNNDKWYRKELVKTLIIQYKLILRLLKKMTRNDSLGRTLKAGPASQAGRPKRPDNRPDVRPTGCPVQA